MKHYSMREIKQSLPKAKNKGDSLWVQYVVRNISYPFTFVFINLGFTAWSVSMLSVIVAFVACFLFFIDSDVARWIGVSLIHFWMICDCCDGNIARVKKTTSSMGEFIDAQSGYIISAFSCLGLSVAAYHTTSFTKYSILFIILGAIASITNILSRLLHQKYTVSLLEMNGGINTIHEEEHSRFSFQNIRRRIGKELGLSGIFMILIIAAQVFKIYDFITLYYFLFYSFGLLVVICRYSIGAKR